jgi:hypothetical protein
MNKRFCCISRIFLLQAILVAGALARSETTKKERSILIMHYGQSNAGITPAGGHIDGAVASPVGSVLMPNDGKGARGWLGKVPSVPITGFLPIDDTVFGDIQSVVGPAGGAYVCGQGDNSPLAIVRSEAKGGQTFIGNGKNQIGLHLEMDRVTKSQIYNNLIGSITAIVAQAAVDGIPVQTIYIPFTHQEADMGSEGASYLTQLQSFISDVETDLTPLGIPVVWLLDQAGGTTGGGNGNVWPARLVLQDAADTAENVHLIGPRYPYPIFDRIHWTNRGKVLYGELLGLAISELENGNPFYAARVRAVSRTENVITITFDSQYPLTFDDNTPFPVNISFKGFTLDGVKNGAQIISAEVTGLREVTITLDKVPSGSDMKIRYAYRSRDASESDDSGWVVGNGALREAWSAPSRVFPSETLYKWIPGFEKRI